MTLPLMTRTALIFTAAALLASGCVQQKRFRFVPTQTACFSGSDSAGDITGPSGQWPSLDCRFKQYKMAAIEFDESGRMFDPKQEEAARRLIEFEKKRAPNGKIITVIYVHGWKNNASQAPPGGKPKDVEKFQGALFELGSRAARVAGAPDKAVPVVGVYLAWRGKTLMGPSWFTFASLWSRRNTANKVGDGPDLGSIVSDYITLTNTGSDQSRVVLIGHSFGARVLEHALESKDIRLHEPPGPVGIIRPRVDLVLYVNSANDSRLSMKRVQELQKENLTVRHPDFDPAECDDRAKVARAHDSDLRANRCREYPLLVAISSTGDLATKRLLPIANTINGDKLSDDLAEKIPDPPKADEFLDEPPSTGNIRKNAAAFFGFLQSHVVHEVTCPAVRRAAQPPQANPVDAMIEEAVRRAVADALGKQEQDDERRKREAAEARRRQAAERAQADRALRPLCPAENANCSFVFRTLGEKPVCYQVDKRRPEGGRRPFNETPFWIMNVPPTVIKDHGDIWNVSFVEMLGQLMAPRGFFEPTTGRMQIRAAGAPSK